MPAPVAPQNSIENRLLIYSPKGAEPCAPAPCVVGLPPASARFTRDGDR